MQEATNQPASKLAQATRLIQYHAIGAGALGLVPLPLVDFALMTGVQVNLVRKLAEIYELPFSEERGRSLVSALIGSSVSGAVFLGAMIAIPLFPVRLVSVSAASAAMTYALGKVFVQHFESGGTFLTFDPEKVREHFTREFRKTATRTEPAKTPEDLEVDSGKTMP